jgi:hypothetical protein
MGWCHANNLRVLHATCALLLACIYSAKLWHGPLNVAHILQAHPESDDGNIHCNYIAFYAANVDWPECCCWPTCTVCDIKYASMWLQNSFYHTWYLSSGILVSSSSVVSCNLVSACSEWSGCSKCFCKGATDFNSGGRNTLKTKFWFESCWSRCQTSWHQWRWILCWHRGTSPNEPRFACMQGDIILRKTVQRWASSYYWVSCELNFNYGIHSLYGIVVLIASYGSG